jgi:hypothetical protein
MAEAVSARAGVRLSGSAKPYPLLGLGLSLLLLATAEAILAISCVTGLRLVRLGRALDAD